MSFRHKSRSVRVQSQVVQPGTPWWYSPSMTPPNTVIRSWLPDGSIDPVTTRFLSVRVVVFFVPGVDTYKSASPPLTDHHHHHLPPHRSQTITIATDSHPQATSTSLWFLLHHDGLDRSDIYNAVAKAAIAAYKSISSYPPPRHRHPPHRLRFIVSSNDMAAVVRLRPRSSTPILLVAYDTLPILLITIVGGVTSSG